MAKEDTRLVYAISIGDKAEALRLLKNEADAFDLNDVFNKQDQSYTCLTKAAELGDIELVAELVSHGAKVNTRNNFGATALTYAAKYGHVSIIEFLLKNDADAELATERGYTPLAIAYKTQQSIDVFRALLEGGAKAGIVEPEKGTTLLETAIESGNDDLLALAIAAKPDLNNVNDNNGATPLRLAVRLRNTNAVRALIDAGAKLDKKNKDGYTALMFAAELGLVEITQMLVNAKADTTIKNAYRQTADEIAENAGYMDVCAIIRKGPTIEDAFAKAHQNIASLKESLGGIQESLQRIQQTLLNDKLSQIVMFDDVEKARAFLDNGFWNKENRPTLLWEHLKIALLHENRAMIKLLTTWQAPCTAEHLADLQKELPEKYPAYIKLLRAAGADVPRVSIQKASTQEQMDAAAAAARREKPKLSSAFNAAANDDAPPPKQEPKPRKGGGFYPFT